MTYAEFLSTNFGELCAMLEYADESRLSLNDSLAEVKALIWNAWLRPKDHDPAKPQDFGARKRRLTESDRAAAELADKIMKARRDGTLPVPAWAKKAKAAADSRKKARHKRGRTSSRQGES